MQAVILKANSSFRPRFITDYWPSPYNVDSNLRGTGIQRQSATRYRCDPGSLFCPFTGRGVYQTSECLFRTLANFRNALNDYGPVSDLLRADSGLRRTDPNRMGPSNYRCLRYFLRRSRCNPVIFVLRRSSRTAGEHRDHDDKDGGDHRVAANQLRNRLTSVGPVNPGNTVSTSVPPRRLSSISVMTVRKSVVILRSSPSARFGKSSPGQSLTT